MATRENGLDNETCLDMVPQVSHRATASSLRSLSMTLGQNIGRPPSRLFLAGFAKKGVPRGLCMARDNRQGTKPCATPSVKEYDRNSMSKRGGVEMIRKRFTDGVPRHPTEEIAP